MRRFFLVIISFFLFVNESFGQVKEKPLFRFGIISDVQYADRDNAGSRHYRSSLRKLNEAIDTFNNQGVDFVISLGDFINDNFHSFDTLDTIMKRLQAPVYHVIGNHEFSIDEDQKKEVPAALGLKRPYYSFVKQHWRYIMLNGNDISLMANAAGTKKYQEADQWVKELKAEKAPNTADWNGGIGEKQFRWLKRELSKSKRKNQPVIICCHQPLFSAKKHDVLRRAKSVSSLIESYPNVKVFLAGHTHISEYFQQQGVNYITFKGIVEKEENAFAILSVYRDHLEITGYEKEISRDLPLH